MANKYDMMGLEMMDSSYDLGAFMTPEMLKESLMSGASGAAGILLVSTLLNKIDQPEMFTGENAAMNWRRTKSVAAVAIGVLGGRMIYERNPQAAMGFLGGVAGLGIADLVASFINDPASADGPTVRTQLSGGHLSGGDLAMLEAAVSQSYPAWQPGLNGTVAQSQQLSAPVVSNTELGAYMPFLS